MEDKKIEIMGIIIFIIFVGYIFITMTEERFSDLGRVEAIARLYEGTPFPCGQMCVYSKHFDKILSA